MTGSILTINGDITGIFAPESFGIFVQTGSNASNQGTININAKKNGILFGGPNSAVNPRSLLLNGGNVNITTVESGTDINGGIIDQSATTPGNIDIKNGTVLTVNSKADGIRAKKGTLNIQSSTVNITAEGNGMAGNEGITMNNSTVTVDSRSYAIYTDSVGAGTSSSKDITINATGLTVTSNKNAIYARNININSGQITTTAAGNNYAIAASNMLTLDYSSAGDFIKASSYFGDGSNGFVNNVTFSKEFMILENGQRVDGSSIIEELLNGLAGKTLIPYNGSKFRISIDPGLSHGTFTTDKTSGNINEIVTVTPVPDNGYEASSVKYKVTGSSEATNISKDTNDRYAFNADKYWHMITGSFAPVNYTITYDGLEGASFENGAANPDTYTVETDSFTLNNPTKEGWTFLGWTGTDLNSASTSVTVAKGSTGNRTYTATWENDNYTNDDPNTNNGGNNGGNNVIPNEKKDPSPEKYIDDYEEPEPNRYEVFVGNLYKGLLLRKGRKSEVTYWVNKLTGKELSLADVVRRFVDSDEFKARNLDDVTYVDSLYKGMFGRSPEEWELKYWLDAIANSADRDNVLAGFLNSDEFFGVRTKVRMAKGDVSNRAEVKYNQGLYEFVLRNYHIIL
ncbi:MAG TPA: hypothetical protein DCG85_01560, partial [Lachnospiraceae bacterium]|nr:hypothetical protein [Lachnospiraceae bacterium]